MKKIIIIFWLLLFPFLAQAQMIFTEIMYDPAGADGGNEWVEVYNNAADPVTLDSGWRFTDSSNHTLNLTQGTSTIAVGQFAIIADNATNFLTANPVFSGNLFDSVVNINNNSSTIALKNNNEPIASLIFDSGWGAAGNGMTLEKINFDGGDEQGNWQESFVNGGTPGRASSVKPESLATTTIEYSGLRINEMLPDPVGDDAAGEWIELVNNSDLDLPLVGVIITDGSGSNYIFASSTIAAKNYWLLSRPISDIALNNSSDTLTLKDPQGATIDAVSYTGSVEGKSWALIDNRWIWSRQPTPGAANILPLNHKPEIGYSISSLTAEPKKSILFDASTSRDQDGDELTYYWDFGDNDFSNRKSISHKYADEGEYLTLLRVQDSSGALAEQTFKITIMSAVSAAKSMETAQITSQTTSATTTGSLSDTVKISEFLPDPVGNDNSEWIELYNSGDADVILDNWKLDDIEGGSRPFIFPQGTVIKPGEYQVWSKAATKLVLNNTTDGVRLLWPDGQVSDSIDYDATKKEGQSYEKNFADDEWQWQTVPTPGLPRIEVLGLETTSQPVATSSDLILPANSIMARVIVPPGTWAKQKMFVRLVGADSWAEVYQYKGQFPEIKSGDIIVVSDAVIGSVSGTPRLKIAGADQIAVTGHDDIIWDEPINISSLSDNDVGSTITLAGLIDTSNKSSLTLVDDEGETIKVTLAPNNTVPLTKNVRATIHGILQKNSTGLYLRLISNNDATLDEQVGIVQQTTTSTTTTLPAQTKDWSGWIAGIVTAFGGLAYAGYKWWFVK
ncbi:MAG: lamin tail domain-containing protein [Candidatus Komeilibacteria bacterium]